MTEREIAAFQSAVWKYYAEHGRHDLPWRAPEPDGSFDPYKILVSELMLQQTQVSRVRIKYAEFLRQFPTVRDLAAASLGDVLIAWQGLGYNRRAKFLWQAAQKIIQDFNGVFPEMSAELETLPGVGKNTAGAILAYAFDQPVAYLETNIRTVYIHYFFKDHVDISDKQILKLVEKSLPTEKCREWYWALMDYGTYLKQTVGNLNKHSKSYTKQSKFEGSLRQIRGQVLRQLSSGPRTFTELADEIPDGRLKEVLQDLEREMLVQHLNERYSLFHS